MICKYCGYIVTSAERIPIRDGMHEGKFTKVIVCPDCRMPITVATPEVERVDNPVEPKHPLLNPDSKHYQMVDGVEAIARLEEMFTTEELMVWSKITAMKYRLRIGNKDNADKEAKKIKTFEDYYTYLKEQK